MWQQVERQLTETGGVTSRATNGAASGETDQATGEKTDGETGEAFNGAMVLSFANKLLCLLLPSS